MTADIIGSVRIAPQVSQILATPSPVSAPAEESFSEMLSREVSSKSEDRETDAGTSSRESTKSLEPGKSREEQPERDEPRSHEDQEPKRLQRVRLEDADEQGLLSKSDLKDLFRQIVGDDDVETDSAQDDVPFDIEAALSAIPAEWSESKKSDTDASDTGTLAAKTSPSVHRTEDNAPPRFVALSQSSDRAETDGEHDSDGISTRHKNVTQKESFVELAREEGHESGKDTDRVQRPSVKTVLPDKPELDVEHNDARRVARDPQDGDRTARSREAKESEGNSLVIDVRDHRRERSTRSTRQEAQAQRAGTEASESAAGMRTRAISQTDAGGQSDLQNQRDGSAFASGLSQNTSAAMTHGDTRSDAAMRLAQTLRDQGAADIVRQAQVILRDNNEGELRLLLRPESLGTVRIRMEMIEDRVALRIFVDNETAGEAFRDSIADLQRSFEESGVSTSSVEVTVEDGSQGDSGQHAASDEAAREQGLQRPRDRYSENEHATADVFSYNGGMHTVNVMA